MVRNLFHLARSGDVFFFYPSALPDLPGFSQTFVSMYKYIEYIVAQVNTFWLNDWIANTIQSIHSAMNFIYLTIHVMIPEMVKLSTELGRHTNHK